MTGSRRLRLCGAADDVLATGRALAARSSRARAGWVYSWSERPRAALRNAMAGLPG